MGAAFTPLAVHTAHGTGVQFMDQVNRSGTRYRVQGPGVQFKGQGKKPFMGQVNISGTRYTVEGQGVQ